MCEQDILKERVSPNKNTKTGLKISATISRSGKGGAPVPRENFVHFRSLSLTIKFGTLSPAATELPVKRMNPYSFLLFTIYQPQNQIHLRRTITTLPVGGALISRAERQQR